jgi:hypothetical protein
MSVIVIVALVAFIASLYGLVVIGPALFGQFRRDY